jgi:hypothetical protein
MCVNRGAPRKPSYGPCNEQFKFADLVGAMVFAAAMAPLLKLMQSVMESLESQTKEAQHVCE